MVLIFIKIAQIKGAGNSNIKIKYSYEDDFDAPKITYL